MMESKKEIYDLIPQHYYPKTELIRFGSSLAEIIQTFEKSGIGYPFIAKPDIGLRGSAVKKIHNPAELNDYIIKADFDFLLQDLIPYPNEIGVFYVRYPHQTAGIITGIVAKEFLIVTGDGVSSIEMLIKQDPRYEFQLKALQREYGKKLLDVPALNEKINLVPYGNHARGAKFIDASDWITPEFTNTMNAVCLQIDGFYFGRIDLMYDTFAELEQGKNFSIVEINGSGSEPTHIYDPKHSLFFAWKELMRHITYMFEISMANKKRGIPLLKHKDGMKEYRMHLAQSKKIVNF